MHKLIKKNSYMPVLLAIAVILAITFIFTLYSIIIHKNLNDEVIVTLNEASLQTAKALKNKITGDMNAITDVALMISNMEDKPEVIIDALKKVADTHRFMRMGMVKPDGTTVTTDGRITRLPDRPYIRAALRGETSVSDRLMDIVDGRIIIVYGAPIYSRDWRKVEAVLFGTFSIEEYHTSLATNSFDGKGYSYIVDRNGYIISASGKSKGMYEFENILQTIAVMDKSKKKALESLINGMQNDKHGYVEFISNSRIDKAVEKYMYYTPLGVNDWYLLMAVPTDALNKKMFVTLGLTFLLACVIIAICSVILVILLKSQKASKKVLEDIVYVSKTTGNMSYEKFKLDAKAIIDKPHSRNSYALVSLDIDKFKYINDMFGYNEGDKLIRYMDRIFSKNCREDELSAHVGADDFVLLLRYRDRKSLCARLGILTELIEEYKRPDNKNYKISVSMGVYEISDNDIDMDTMKDRAEIPRKQAKINRALPYAFYDETVREKILKDREMENRMAYALEKGEFVVFYQPKFWTQDGGLAGAEALVRWKQEDGTLLPPGAFVPLFEENGFIVQLDRYVFEQVCKDVKRWMEQGLYVLPISSNMSRKNIVIENIAYEYDAIISEFGIPKNLVALELTETAFVESDSIIGYFVTKMNERGFNIIMDDFGMGFSSLGLLIKMDIDTLKLDRSLVRDIDNNDKSRAVVGLVIRLMHKWNVKVNAEGVETSRQLENLSRLRCDEVQGYYFAKPMPADEYEKLLSRTQETDTATGLCD